ncbi:MAG TPA: hypothetical protein VNZ43_01195 [Sphingomonadaceae bacterium]|nr:hypothetical protein [Sphingomonadaceae bacterium]
MAFSGSRIALGGLALASALALGGCYNDGYGYSGVSVGYGTGGYYGYDYPYYYDGYGYPGYGWYDGFYYPGNGYYVYDRGGRRHRWSDSQRRYWESHRGDHGHRGDGHWNGGRPGNGDHGQWQGRSGGLRNPPPPNVNRSQPRPPRASAPSPRVNRAPPQRSGDGGRPRGLRDR